jgi:drug/metabolite transporter (DMT)-like permease
MLLALAAMASWGVAALMQKASTLYLSGEASAMWFLLAFVPVGLVIVLRSPLPSRIAPETWALAAALGFTLGLGNLTVLLAYSHGGKAAVIAPLSGLYPAVSLPIAIFAFGERLEARETAGIALALVAVVLLSYAPGPKSAEPRLPGG